MKDVKPRVKVPSEAKARQWRYERLEQRGRQAGADVVTGHTASDRAETMLLQLARGSDLAGLAALPSVRPLSPEGPRLRRPLLLQAVHQLPHPSLTGLQVSAR